MFPYSLTNTPFKDFFDGSSQDEEGDGSEPNILEDLLDKLRGFISALIHDYI